MTFILLLLLGSVILTVAASPTPPSDLRVDGKTENALFLRWTPPKGSSSPFNTSSSSFRRDIRGYKVTATPISTLGSELGPIRSWEWLEPSLNSASVVSLTPATEYRLELATLGDANGEISVPATVKSWTRIGTPDPPPPPRLEWQQGTQMGVSLSPGKNDKGPISFYRLALVDDRQLGFDKDTIVGWQEASEIHLPYYVAAQWDDPYYFPSTFTLGDGSRLGGFYNGPLPSHAHWHPALGVGSTWENVTKIQYSSTGHFQHKHLSLSNDQRAVEEVSGGGGGLVTGLWIAIGATSILLLLVLGLFLLIKLNLMRKNNARSRRRREAHPLAHSNSQMTNNTGHSSISTISGAVPYSYSNDFADCGGYTHLSYVPEEEDWGRKVLLGLATIPCIPRAAIVLPPGEGQVQGQSHEEAVLIANGRFGPVWASLHSNQRPVQLFQLPLIPSGSGGGGKRKGSSSWDEASFRALNAILAPSSHVNVISSDGFLQTESSLYLVLSGEGIPLKTELHRWRDSPSKSSQALLLCAMGVAEGLFHLHSYNLIHGELCSWSVVLPGSEEWSNPKLTGFGLLSVNPVGKERDRTRWMSLEALHSRTAPPSDSWGFGVLLWEIATLGGTPFFDIKTEDVKKRVERGARPPQLEIHGDGLYQLMLSCWQIDREERPDPETLACHLHQLLPTANDELGLWDSFKWPPYIESLEFLPSSK